MSTEECVVQNEGTPVTQEVDNDQDIQLPPPIVTRTRSGRTVRAPSTLIDSLVTRTPTRRSRKAVVKDVPKENVETDSNPAVPVETNEANDLAPCIESQDTEAVAEPADEGKTTTDIHRSLSTPMETAPDLVEKMPKKRTHSESSGKQTTIIPLGKPKSGRVWKDRNKQRFSALLRDKPLRSSWEKKMEARREKDLVKQYSLQLKNEKAKQKEAKRMRREETLRRRAENERKAEVVQVIRNTTKIKRMKKKQLRKIEKRDTLAFLQKSKPQNPKATGKDTKKGSQ